MLQSVQSRKAECGTGRRCGVPESWRVLLEDSDKPFPLLAASSFTASTFFLEAGSLIGS